MNGAGTQVPEPLPLSPGSAAAGTGGWTWTLVLRMGMQVSQLVTLLPDRAAERDTSRVGARWARGLARPVGFLFPVAWSSEVLGGQLLQLPFVGLSALSSCGCLPPHVDSRVS